MTEAKEQSNCTHSFCFSVVLCSLVDYHGCVARRRAQNGMGARQFLRSLQHTEYLHLDYMIIS